MANDITRDKLRDDLNVLVSDAEALLRATAGQAGESVSAARARIEASLADARVKLADLQYAAIDQTRQAVRVADDYVHENPWRAVGVAALGGLILGLLIGRR